MKIALSKLTEKPGTRTGDALLNADPNQTPEEGDRVRHSLMILTVLLILVLSNSLFTGPGHTLMAPPTTLSLPSLRIGVADDSFAARVCAPQTSARGASHFILYCQSYPASSYDILLQAVDSGAMDLAILPLDLFQQWSVHRGQETSRALTVLGHDHDGLPVVLAGASAALEQKQSWSSSTSKPSMASTPAKNRI